MRRTANVLRSIAVTMALVSNWAILFAAPYGYASDTGEPLEVKYYSRGNSPGLRPYQNDLLKLALEKTRRDYGDYEITYYSEQISSSRAKFETERGRLINLHFSTGWDGEFLNENNIIKIRHPIFKGLLGMRSIIVRKEDIPRFRNINSLEQLRKFSAGQGKSWLDVSILENQKIPVVHSTVFENLAPMLVARRFEYLPLSILEARAALISMKPAADKLAISEDLAIFYPIPIHLCISKFAPEISERLDVGVARSLSDGSLDKLFEEHFGSILQSMARTRPKTVLLDNPHLSEEMNRAATSEFLANYGAHLPILSSKPLPFSAQEPKAVMSSANY